MTVIPLFGLMKTLHMLVEMMSIAALEAAVALPSYCSLTQLL